MADYLLPTNGSVLNVDCIHQCSITRRTSVFVSPFTCSYWLVEPGRTSSTTDRCQGWAGRMVLSRQMDTMLAVFMMVLVTITMVRGEAREDGLCGPGNNAPSGVEANCEHIPPFPTCCQKNGHCGWDCDDGRNFRLINNIFALKKP